MKTEAEGGGNRGRMSRPQYKAMPLISACFHTTIVLRPKGHFKTFWYKVFVLPF